MTDEEEWEKWVHTLSFEEARALILETIRMHESGERRLRPEVYAQALAAEAQAAREADN